MLKTIINIYPAIASDTAYTIINNDSVFAIHDVQIRYSILQSSIYSSISLFTKQNLNQTSFMKSGQKLSVTIQDDEGFTKDIYQGYIVEIRFNVLPSGISIVLICDQLLGQLTRCSSNQSYNDATKRYDTIMAGVSGNQINFNRLLFDITFDTLVTGFTIVNGKAPPIPNSVWAVPMINETRDKVLRDILFVYNRVMYQTQNGDASIEPLFIDDYANKAFNIDLLNNDSGCISYELVDKSAIAVNRFDFMFAALLPINNTNPTRSSTGNNIFTSAYPSEQYFTRITELEKTKRFPNYIMGTKALNNQSLTDASLINSLNLVNSGGYNTANTKVTSSAIEADKLTVPKIYSSNLMSASLTDNTVLRVTYNYEKVYKYNILKKINNVIGLNKFTDSNSNNLLAIDATINISPRGLYINVTYIPLGCIYGKYYNV